LKKNIVFEEKITVRKSASTGCATFTKNDCVILQQEDKN